MDRQITFRQSAILGLLGLTGFIGLWHGLALSGMISSAFLPSPLEVYDRFAILLERRFAGATLPGHLAASFQRFAYGFLLAALIRHPAWPCLMGWYQILDEIVSPLFDALRFIAPIAWVPFAALWFGTGIGGPIMIIFAGAFPPCVINAYRGAKFVDPPPDRGGEHAGHAIASGDPRNPAAVIRALDHLWLAGVCGSGLAVAGGR